MTQNQDSEIGRNIRIGLVGILDLWTSKDAQLEYQKNVPIAHVSAELFCQWYDDYYQKDSPIIEKEFTQLEREALAKFDKVINHISDITPDDLPNIEEFIKTNEWRTVNQVAIEVLPKIKRPE